MNHVANEHIDWTASSAGTIHSSNIPAIARTTVQIANSQSAQLSLTTQEGDVVVRSDSQDTYMHNGGSAGTMGDFTLLSSSADNSTNVTLVTTSHDYLSISGQAITLGTIDISDDTNLTAGTGITLTGDTLSVNTSAVDHDSLSNFVANLEKYKS